MASPPPEREKRWGAADSLVIEFQRHVPGSPDVGTGPRTLYVEPIGGGKAIVGTLKDGPTLDHQVTLPRVGKIEDWLRSTCGAAKAACFERLIYRVPKGPIEETVGDF